jgi:hypothetical protein
LTEVLADGEQTPAGQTLCGSCFSALWGPKTTLEFRVMVAQHSGRYVLSQPAR